MRNNKAQLAARVVQGRAGQGCERAAVPFGDGGHELGDLETFVTQTEKEAALLENSLIKEHQLGEVPLAMQLKTAHGHPIDQGKSITKTS